MLGPVQVAEYAVAKKGCGNESIIPWWLQGLADGGSDSVNGQGQTLGMELHVWNCARRSLTHAP